jgi:hypothetical protein
MLEAHAAVLVAPEAGRDGAAIDQRPQLRMLTSGSRLMNGSSLCGSDSGPRASSGSLAAKIRAASWGVAASSPSRWAAW